MTTPCSNCDAPLIDGHRFCRVCGVRVESTRRRPPQADPVTDGCPSCGRAPASHERYCRMCGAALRAAADARPSRDVPNALPDSATAPMPRRAPVAHTQRIAPAVSAPEAAPHGPSNPRAKRVRLTLLAAGAAALLGCGVFAGLTLFGSDDGGARTDGNPGADNGAKPSLLPSISEAEMAQQVRDLFVNYYANVADDDIDTAFHMLSSRKQNAALRRSGLDAWMEAQAGFTRYLDPSGLSVAVEYADPATGVVRVHLSGMTYTDPSSSCSTWSGITWVKYEQSAFHYDPGYSTTPQRTRDWKSRESELLGIGC